MSATETTMQYRLEVRLGRAGWRWHLRGPTGIEGSGPVPFATRGEALEDGRATLSANGLEGWSEWMDGVTDNHYDPRTERVPTVDAVAEARRAGLVPPDPVAMKKATEAIRELEAKKEAALVAQQKATEPSADVGMGLTDPPTNETVHAAPKTTESPLKAQRKRTAGASKVAEE